MKPAPPAEIAAIARSGKAFRPNIESSLNAKAQARFARQSNGIVRGVACQFKVFADLPRDDRGSTRPASARRAVRVLFLEDGCGARTLLGKFCDSPEADIYC
jgi:hypothetical protein